MTHATDPDRHWHLTWLGSDRLLARRVARPVARFLRIEAAGGVLLLAATVAALVWANVAAGSYDSFWSTPAQITVGGFHLDMSLQEWVNEGLMALFFFVVGMEIKREATSGELRDPKAAALPVIAAIGGMVAPALFYLAFNAGGIGSRGWGIPMATDIAFAVGIVSLLGTRVPISLKLFLLTLAVVDDIGGMVVIAVWYANGVSFAWLGAAAAVFVAMYLSRRAGVWYLPVYLVLGVLAWYLMLRSGVHATIAGVVAGLLTPTRPLRADLDVDEVAGELAARPQLSAADVRVASRLIKGTVPVNEWLSDLLHPWTGLVVIPVFALANAAIPLDRGSLSAAMSSSVTIGVLVGLVVGKTLGVSLTTLLAVRLGIGARPRGATNTQVIGISMATGIGFTVSMFMAGVSFADTGLQDEAKVGIFAASIVAAVLSSAVLLIAHRRATPEEIAYEEAAEDALFVEEPEIA